MGKTEREMSSVYWFASQMASTVRFSPGQSQEAWMPFGTPTWVAGTCELELSSATSSERYIWGGLAMTWNQHTYGMPRGGSTHCATTLALPIHLRQKFPIFMFTVYIDIKKHRWWIFRFKALLGSCILSWNKRNLYYHPCLSSDYSASSHLLANAPGKQQMIAQLPWVPVTLVGG